MQSLRFGSVRINHLPDCVLDISVWAMPVSTKPENSGLRSLANRAQPPAVKSIRNRWIPDDADSQG